MPSGLPVSKLIQVTLNLTPQGAQFANFDTCLIIGDSNVINVKDRFRSYAGITEVAADFGTLAAEYLAADLFFSQQPQPTQLYIGRWAKTATNGLLVGGILTPAEQAIGNWTTIIAGEFKLAVDGGAATNCTCGTFAGATNLNAVAGIIQTAVQALGGSYAAATVVWNGEQFIFASGTTGAASSVAALTAGTANDISAQLMGTAATLEELVPGIAAESAVACVEVMDTLNFQFYGLTFAAGAGNADISDSDHLAIAAYIEADAQNPHLYGLTTAESAALSTSDSTSIGYQLRQLGYRRTFSQWSAENPFACTSIFGRGCTVNFAESLSTITFMWKQEPGVIAENLTLTQSQALDINHYNYFANFNNNTAIVVNGMVANGDFIDNTWDLDWFVNQIQTNVYNLLYTSGKVPQTDAGEHLIKNAIEAACVAAVNNGILGPGVWNAPGFGQLQQGGNLPNGYYVYQPPVASQAESSRAARQSVAFQVAAKLAGAVHTVSVSVNVNL